MRSLQQWGIASAVLVIAAGVAFLPTIQILVRQWMTNDTYSFGVLVPPISAYFVWLQRKRLQQLPVTPEPLTGMLLVSCCAAMLVFGRAVAVTGIQQIAMVLTVPALIWLLLGRQWVRALWFPLLYLLLMIPIWEFFTDRFHYRFQLFSAHLSERLLSAAGVPVHRSDTYLSLPNITLEVASVCSGVNFLIAVIAIGVPQAYLFLQGWFPRSLVIGFALAIAMLSNGLRIAIIGVLSHYELSTRIHGPGHLLQGLFVSGAGLIALQIAIVSLSRRYPRQTMPKPMRPQPSIRHTAGWLVLGSAMGAAAVMVLAAKVQPHDVLASPASADSKTLELSPRWRLVNAAQAVQFVQGGPHPNLGRAFQIGEDWSVEVYAGDLAYTAPGGGLGYRQVSVPTQAALSEIPVQTPQGIIFVNNISFRSGGRETDVAFWYDVSGAATSQVTTAKLNALWSLVTGTRPLPKLVVLTRTRELKLGEAEPLTDFVADVLHALKPQAAAFVVRPPQQPL